MLCHLLGLLTNFVGPLIIWLIKKGENAFIERHGKEALNFQITLALAWIVSAILTPVFCIGAILGLAVLVCNIIFSVMASLAASKGSEYRYPVSLRLIK